MIDLFMLPAHLHFAFQCFSEDHICITLWLYICIVNKPLLSSGTMSHLLGNTQHCLNAEKRGQAAQWVSAMPSQL